MAETAEPQSASATQPTPVADALAALPRERWPGHIAFMLGVTFF